MDFETLLDTNCFHDHVNYFYDDRRIAEQRVPKITRQLSAARRVDEPDGVVARFCRPLGRALINRPGVMQAWQCPLFLR